MAGNPPIQWGAGRGNRIPLDENAPILALPSGLKLPYGDVLPIPSVFILDSSRDSVDHLALADQSSDGRLEQFLRKSLQADRDP